MNGYIAFFVPSDVSKAMEEISDPGDRRREKSIGWLFKRRYADGSNPYRFVEIRYGDDDGRPSQIITDSRLARKPRAPSGKILF